MKTNLHRALKMLNVSMVVDSAMEYWGEEPVLDVEAAAMREAKPRIERLLGLINDRLRSSESESAQ